MNKNKNIIKAKKYKEGEELANLWIKAYKEDEKFRDLFTEMLKYEFISKDTDIADELLEEEEDA